MADILLQKPAAAQSSYIAPQADERLVFGFTSSDATLTRVDNNLVMSFEDGASLVLTDFYVVYTAENMPTFMVEGTEIDGESFFAALGEELMPAAGSVVSADSSGNSVDTIAGTLLDGVDRLGRLDQEYPHTTVGVSIVEVVAAKPTDGTGSATALGEKIVLETPPSEDENTPPIVLEISPIVPNDSFVAPEGSGAHVNVHESGVGRDDDGYFTDSSNEAYDGELSTTGKVTASDADDDTLSFTIVGDGQGEYGSITMNPETGEFTYTLDDEEADSLGENENVQESFQVEVDDGRGGVTTTTIVVNISGTNDQPTLELEDASLVVTEDEGVNSEGNLVVSGTAISTDADSSATETFYVAKGDGAMFDNEESASLDTTGLTQEGNVLQGQYGTFTIDANGKYTYTVDNDAIQHLGAHDTLEESFSIYVQDDKGAWRSEVVHVTVNGANDKPSIAPESPQSPDGSGGSMLNVSVTEAGVKDGNTAELGTSSSHGNLQTQDVDGGDTHTYSVSDGVAGTYSVDGSAYDTKVEGTYGDLYLDSATGNYIYVLNNDYESTNSLTEGATGTDEFNVFTTDSGGLTSDPAKLTVTVDGTNDQPTLSLDKTSLELTEDVAVNAEGDIVVSGTASSSDADDGATETFYIAKGDGAHSDNEEGGALDTTGLTQEGNVLQGQYGTFTIDANGKYTYTVDNDAIQHLGADDTREESFSIYVQDDNGAWRSEVVHVTVNGANDAPSIAPEIPQNPDGSGDSAESGGTGGSVGSMLNVSVTEAGVKDGNTAEAGTPSVTGSLKTQDADTGDSHTYSVSDGVAGTYSVDGNAYDTKVEGTYGDLYLDSATGNYIYVVNNAYDTTNSLAEGATGTDEFNVFTTDSGGLTSDPAKLTVTVDGTNDQPTLSLDKTSLELTEDVAVNAEGDIVVSGTASSSDADDGATETFYIAMGDGAHSDNEEGGALDTTGLTQEGNVLQGQYGTFTIDANGKYTYTVDNDAIQHLGADDTREESFSIYVQDDNGAWRSEVVHVTVNGANDAPSIAPESPQNPDGSDGSGDSEGTGSTAGSMLNVSVTEAGVKDGNTAEAGTPSVTGSLKTQDADAGDTHTYSVSDGVAGTYSVDGSAYDTKVEGTYGDLYLDSATGNYIYVVNNAYDTTNSLAEGATGTDEFNVFTTDSGGLTSDPAKLSVTVDGTNDQPTLSLDKTSLELTEDVALNAEGDLVVSGTASSSDADDGATETFYIAKGDGAHSDNEEGGALDTTGLTQEGNVLQGQYGTFTIDANGKYTYTVDNDAIQHLGAEDTREESFSIYVQDDNGAWRSEVVHVTVNGANDAPSIAPETPQNPDGSGDSGDSTGSGGTGGSAGSMLNVSVTEAGVKDGNTAEAGTPSVTGSLKTQDADTGDTHTYSVSDGVAGTYSVDGNAYDTKVEGTYGDLYLDSATGNYIYVVNNAYDTTNSLAEGATGTDEFNVFTTDSGGLTSDPAKLTVTVDGTNDQPTLSLDKTSLELTEDVAVNAEGDIVVSGTASSSDADDGATETFYIATGDGANSDNEEGGALDTTGLTQEGNVLQGQYGTFTIDANGKYTYTVDNDAIQHLSADDTREESFSIYVQDDNGAWRSEVVHVTVNGANDAPSIAPEIPQNPDGSGDSAESGGTGGSAGSMLNVSVTEAGVKDGNTAEAGTPSVTGSLKTQDADAGDTHTYSVSDGVAGNYSVDGNAYDTKVEGTYGDLYLDSATGDYIYVINNAYDTTNSLTEGVTGTDEFNVFTTDSGGLTSDPAKLTVTVDGTNDQPTLSLDKTNLELTEDVAVNAEGDIVVSGTASSSDADDGATETFYIATGDGANSDNEEGGALDTTGLTQEGNVLQGQYGTFTIDANGKYTYTVDNDAIQYLGADDTREESFSIYVQDDNGAWRSEVVHVTVNGANDAPTIITPATADPDSDPATVTKTDLLTEDATLSSDSGQIVFTSADDMHGGTITVGGEVFTVVYDETTGEFTLQAEDGTHTVHGEYGNLSVDSTLTYENGEFTLTYIYEQTKAYEHDSDVNNDRRPDNDHDQIQESADSFDVLIQDSKEAANSVEGAKVTINVDIKDAGPTILTDYDANGVLDSDPGQTEAAVASVDGDKYMAETTISVDFGADGPHQIQFPGYAVGTAATYVFWDGDTQTWELGFGFRDIFNYSKTDNGDGTVTHTIVMGDVTMTSSNNQDWTVTYEVADGRTDVTLNFVDKDNDSVSHTITAEKPQPEESTSSQPEDPTTPPIDPTDTVIAPPASETGQVNDTVYLTHYGSDDVNLSFNYDGDSATNDVVEYKEGLIVNTKDGNDDVWLGQHDDTIYLGESHAENFDGDVGSVDSAVDTFMSGSDQSKTYGTEDAPLNVSDLSGPGVDIAHGGGGDDKIYGEGGTDVIYGGSGNDYIDGGSHNDGIRGGSGNDTIYGGSGDDVLYGGDGADDIFGGSGNDLIFASSDDTIDGGSGKDIISLVDLNSGTALDVDDVVSIDGGVDMDVLLTGMNDIDTVRDILESGKVSNMEVIMLGDNQDAAKDVIENLSIDANGQISDATSTWENTGSLTLSGDRGSYNQFTNDEGVTILVHNLANNNA